MPTEKQYTIGDQTFTQRPLVIGQVEQLLDALKGARFPLDPGNIAGIVIALAGQLPAVLAVVLTPLAQKDDLKSKVLDGIAAHLALFCDLDTAVEVVEDFFALTPVFSISERIAALLPKKPKAPSVTPSSDLESSSAPETSPAGDT